MTGPSGCAQLNLGRPPGPGRTGPLRQISPLSSRGLLGCPRFPGSARGQPAGVIRVVLLVIAAAVRSAPAAWEPPITASRPGRCAHRVAQPRAALARRAQGSRIRPGRAGLCREHGPHDFPRLAGSGVAPHVGDRADDVEAAAGLGEVPGLLENVLGSNTRSWRAASRMARMPSSPRRPRPGAGLRYVPASLAGVVRRYLCSGEESSSCSRRSRHNLPPRPRSAAAVMLASAATASAVGPHREGRQLPDHERTARPVRRAHPAPPPRQGPRRDVVAFVRAYQAVPAFPFRQPAIGHLNRRFQPPLDVQHHPFLVGVRLHRLDHKIMVNRVEELLDIKVKKSR